MIEIYTDGACKGNPGVGGWGALIINGLAEDEIYGGEKETTNNRMELKAVIMALEKINNNEKATIYTDSVYVQKGINEWIDKWKVNGWRASNKKSVKNKDLWVELDELSANFQLTWVWVKGHSGNIGNEKADNLANKGVEQAMRDL
jgi:ribonuclease HI